MPGVEVVQLRHVRAGKELGAAGRIPRCGQYYHQTRLNVFHMSVVFSLCRNKYCPKQFDHFLRRRAIGWVQTGSERVLPATTSLAPTSQTSGFRTGHHRKSNFVILSVFPSDFITVAGMRPSSRSCPSYSKASFKSEPCKGFTLESCS